MNLKIKQKIQISFKTSNKAKSKLNIGSGCKKLFKINLLIAIYILRTKKSNEQLWFTVGHYFE